MFHKMMNYGELEARPQVVLTKDIIKKNMPKFKRHDDLIVVQQSAWEEFKKSLPMPVVREENSPFSIDEDELASLVCQIVQKPACHRLAVEKGIKNDDYRTPDVELILGDCGVVQHKENHITYSFDVTKCMFSFGNINEKMRMAELNCQDEVVVDLFAGIGYFSLPLLVHAKAQHLYACEWNPDAVEALKKNLAANKVDPGRYTVIEGDNKSNRPTDVAQRVILGILPSCMGWMQTAFECIDKTKTATLHCHDLIDSKPTTGGGLNDSANSDKAANNTSQSILTSSTSSHSTLEKLSAPSDDYRTCSSESDKDTNSPVLLERPTSGSLTSNTSISSPESSCNTNDTSSISSAHEDSNIELPQVNDYEFSAYDSRGQTLIASIKDDLDAYDLKASVVHIQPVKSYAPHITHVVIDIKIEPNTTKNNNSRCHVANSRIRSNLPS